MFIALKAVKTPNLAKELCTGNDSQRKIVMSKTINAVDDLAVVTTCYSQPVPRDEVLEDEMFHDQAQSDQQFPQEATIPDEQTPAEGTGP